MIKQHDHTPIRHTLVWLLCLYLTACQSHVTSNENPPLDNPAMLGKTLPYDATYYVQQAARSPSPERERYQLLAAHAWLQAGDPAQAQHLLQNLRTQHLPTTLITQKQLLNAMLSLANNRNNQALSTLTAIPAYQIPPNKQREFHELLATAYERSDKIIESIEQRIELHNVLTSTAAKKQNDQAIWYTLQRVSLPRLTQLTQDERAQNDMLLSGWLGLAYLSKAYADDPDALSNEFDTWQQQYKQHPGNALFSNSRAALSNPEPAPTPREHNITLLLPLHGELGTAGQAIKNGFMTAFYDNKQQQPTEINVIDTSQDKKILAAYQDAIRSGAQFIVGPLAREEVETLLRSGKISVPTLALNYSRATRQQDQLVQFGLSPLDEARQAAEYAWRSQHDRAIIMVPRGAWGEEIATTFATTFRALGGTVVERFVYDNKMNLAQSIKHLLKIDASQERAEALQQKLRQRVRFVPQRREDFNLFFLVANPAMAKQIQPLLRFYFAGDIPVYATSAVYNGNATPNANRDIEGIYFCDIPWMLEDTAQATQARTRLAKLWPAQYRQYLRLYALGADAYRLSRLSDRLQDSANFKLKGATGELSIDSKQRIYRQLHWVQVRNGQLRPIN